MAVQRTPEDDALLSRVFDLLKARIRANPNDWDGKFAQEIATFPKGLRAMAATHHLDVSLHLDDIGWHFVNFGDESHVAETEAGLRTLGLDELADLFAEASRIMKPHLFKIRTGSDYHDCLEQSGETKRIIEISEQARKPEMDIYAAWIKYIRTYPTDVFPD